MKKNVASQLVSAQMVSTTDGSDVTSGTCNVAVETDGSAGTGGTATHTANGKWEYAPIQADTNGDYLTFQFVLSGAVTQTVQIYTTFPQTGDTYALANGSAGFVAIDTVVDSILLDTAEIGTAGAGLTDLGGMSTAMKAEVNAEADTAISDASLATAAALSTAQTDLDTLTGSDGATLATSQANYAPATATALATAQTDLDTLTGSDGATLATSQPNYAPATAAALATVDGNVDSILADTGTDGVVIASAQTVATVTDVTNQVSADVTAISGDSTAADNLEAVMEGVVLAQVNDASATTTAFAADGFTEATDDHFNGRLITFITGALAGQQTDITDYDAAGGTQGSQEFTVTALTEAPAENDYFVIT